MPARCVVLRVRCPWPLGSCSPVCLLRALCCACRVPGHLAPVHWCARSVCCAACAVSLATWLLFNGVPAWCVAVRMRCPGPRCSCSPVRPIRPLISLCGVLGHLAPVHRCARTVGCVVCAVSWATGLPFTGVPARCVVLRVRRPGPLGSCSLVCPLGVLCCVCGVLGHLAPVHRCARSVCCVACAVSWATWPLFTSVTAWCVAVRGRCPGPRGSRSPVCPLGGLCCMCGVLGHLAAVHRCARSVRCVARAASWATWLLFTGVPARCVVPLCAVSWATWLLFSTVPVRCVVLCVRCPGPLGSCSPVRPLRPLICLCGVLGHLAPVHRCAGSMCCFRVGCLRPLGSCSPMCPLGVLCCVCRVLGHLAPVHRCDPLVCCCACPVSWATRLPFTRSPARWVVLRVRCPGPLGFCSLVCPLGRLCCVYGVLGRLALVHRCARSVCCVLGCACGVACAGRRCGALTRPSRRRLFVAGRGRVRCRARTRPSGRRLFVAGRGWVPSGSALVHPDGGWCCLAPVPVPSFVRVVRALRQPLLLGTCPCSLVVAGGVPLWRASWPRLVRSAPSGPVALGALVGFPDAVVPFPTPGAVAPGSTGWLRGARGGRLRTGLIVPAAGPRRGRGAGHAPRRTRSGPHDGVVPGGSLRRRS